MVVAGCWPGTAESPLLADTQAQLLSFPVLVKLPQDVVAVALPFPWGSLPLGLLIQLDRAIPNPRVHAWAGAINSFPLPLAELEKAQRG